MLRGLFPAGEKPDLLVGMGERALRGHAPDLIVAEVANALVVLVRAGQRSLEEARTAFAVFRSSPIELHSSVAFASEAIELAAAGRLSADDAFYAVLAEALDIPLVTADRRLASAVAHSVLVE
jgi:predicted nucleic acid-binding protein